MTERDGWFYLYAWAREENWRGRNNGRRHSDRAQERREYPGETTETALSDFPGGGESVE